MTKLELVALLRQTHARYEGRRPALGQLAEEIAADARDHKEDETVQDWAISAAVDSCLALYTLYERAVRDDKPSANWKCLADQAFWVLVSIREAL